MVLFINPLTVELFIAFIKYRLKFDIDCCIKGDKWDVQKIRQNDKLYCHLTQVLARQIENRYISLPVLHAIAEFALIQLNNNESCSDGKHLWDILEFFRNILKLNEESRNRAAHKLIQISEKQIEDITGMNAKRIIRQYQKIITTTFGSKCPGEVFDIYDNINDYIKNEMEKLI